VTSIRIIIKEDNKAKDFIRFLRDIDFLDIQVEENTEGVDSKGTDALKSISGLWKGRSITLDSIRNKAWAHGRSQQ
jgi:hypothetical protein